MMTIIMFKKYHITIKVAPKVVDCSKQYNLNIQDG